jgi:hypothetical protein
MARWQTGQPDGAAILHARRRQSVEWCGIIGNLRHLRHAVVGLGLSDLGSFWRLLCIGSLACLLSLDASACEDCSGLQRVSRYWITM